MYKALLTRLSIALLTTLPALAPAGAQEHRGHGAHVHGLAALNVAVEGDEVHMELRSPAANMVGFEHPPASAAEHEAVRRAVHRLGDGEALFRLPAPAGCRLEDTRVDTPLSTTDDHHDGTEGAPAGEGHDHHGHDHDGHHEEEARHQPKSGTDTHTDITAVYRFRCERPARLAGLEVTLFEAFPATQRLRVQYITAEGQGAADLTAARPALDF